MKLNEERINTIYKVTDTHIHGFFNKHRYLSNFHLHSIEYEGIIYPSNENAYQAAKMLPGDPQPFLMRDDKGLPCMITRLDFASFTPSESKNKGRSISLRADWLSGLNTGLCPDNLITQVRDKIMYDINVIKFSNPQLRNLLLETGDRYLEETNWWKDDYWGTCNGTGLNKLGRILMKIRDEAKQKQKEAA